jgi:F0F1-type ATP synthase delta subunit
MVCTRAAIRYAKAILEIADSKGKQLTKVNNDMKTLIA